MRTYMFQFRFPLLGILFAAGAVTLAGCGGEGGIDQVTVVPVTTKVLFDGQPLPGAFVVLHPKSGVDAKAIKPHGYVDQEGNFKATTYKAGDGAAIGEFAVTVELRQPVESADGPVLGPNVLPQRYANPHTTDLVIKVAKGQTETPPLYLTR